MSEENNAAPPPPKAPPAPAAGEISQDQRQYAMFTHLSALAGVLIPIPCANILGPLIMWQIKKNDMPFVDDQGKEAVNFQITVAIAVLVCVVLMFVLIGMLLLPIVGIAALVFTIIAGVKANNGEAYRYPMTIRLIK
ncbi:MAG: DUF4870 domain-containing protein [Rhodanobacteraceae bacterium]|nr:DUF4870 domain-containing protein [Xanthomonadales bacterium]MCP5479342.1 DUF4870 domain-containing protein [Rhodanobacteraceae bacterium]HPF73745.1 DUF4870 domain-containing protein [Xanthomonadaceae bacterium]HRY00619.1 DUF4870 domain-containing protein [Xanthomonadaceae bacterium]